MGRDLVGLDGGVARRLALPNGWPGADGRRGKEAQKGAVAAWLCQETVGEGHSVLMFCASKRICQVGAARAGGARALFGGGGLRSVRAGAVAARGKARCCRAPGKRPCYAPGQSKRGAD